MLQGAGNLLIRRTVLEDMHAPWFDPDFALSGGEDQEFFMRLMRAGRTFAWCRRSHCPWRCSRDPRRPGLAAETGLFDGQFRHARS